MDEILLIAKEGDGATAVPSWKGGGGGTRNEGRFMPDGIDHPCIISPWPEKKLLIAATFIRQSETSLRNPDMFASRICIEAVNLSISSEKC